MRSPASRAGCCDGSAVVEFVLLAVVVLVPFVYAVLCVFEVERAAFAVSDASREEGRAFVTASDGGAAWSRADAAGRLVLADHGVRDGTTSRITCDADPCLSPSARVTVRVTAVVPLPLVPRWGGHPPASVTVRAEHVEVVDTYRSVRP